MVISHWTQAEVELIIGWMKENPHLLRGKPQVWHTKIYDQFFQNSEHITITKIRDKLSNMKRSWQAARILMNSSGWGVEDMYDTVNKLLERKCPFFWRLEEIWGTRPNVRVIMDTESSKMPLIMEAREKVLEDEDEDEDADEDADEDEYTSVLSWNETPQPPTRPCSLTPPPIIIPILASRLTQRQPLSVPRSESSTSRSQSSTSRSQSSTPRSESSTPRPSSSTPRPSSSTPSLPKCSEKRDLANIMKRAFEERQASRDEFASKKLKADTEVKLEKIASDDRIAEMQAVGQDRQIERMGRFQEDGHVRSMEVFSSMLQDVLRGKPGKKRRVNRRPYQSESAGEVIEVVEAEEDEGEDE